MKSINSLHDRGLKGKGIEGIHQVCKGGERKWDKFHSLFLHAAKFSLTLSPLECLLRRLHLRQQPGAVV